MADSVAITSLADLVDRLFTKPPSVQKVVEESAAPYVNSLVSDIKAEAIEQLFSAENISTPKEQKEYNEQVSTGTILHLLAFVGRHEAVEWLLKAGAYVHSKNKDGSTPLHVAALNHHPETIRILRFYHGDAHTENKQGKTAVDFSKEDDVKEALLEHRFSAEAIEDEFLQERFELLVERVTSPKSAEDELQSLYCLRSEIRISTASMTSVPKPLKFLRDHYTKLEEAYEKKATSESKFILADILSVLSMAVEDDGNKCLKYRLEGSGEKVSSFGHPYIRRLCSQIPDAWTSSPSPVETLLGLVRDICVYCLEHSAEAEACDLLMEIEKVEFIIELVAEDIYERVCLYLTSCVKYVPEPEDSVLLNTALKIFRKFHCYPQALRLALMLNDPALVKELFLECPDSLVQKQLAFMLGRQQVFLDLEDASELDQSDDLADIMSNVLLNNNFLALARELDIMDPKVPEDIYKSHLEHARFSTANTADSARANLASSFVNAFVNCAFGEDKLLTTDGNKWIYKNKTHGMLSATASLGMILLWDVDGGLTQIDKLLYTNEDYIKSGALLALGLVNVGVRNECDPALALLSDYVLHASNTMRLGAVIGLGLAYAGSMRSDVIDTLTPVMWDDNSSFEIVCLGALSCSLIAVGSCHADLTESILQLMLERDPGDLAKTSVRFLTLALALLYLGKQEAVEATVAALKAVPEPLCSFAVALLETCAYAGTGNVLKIQSLLHVCSEYHKPKDETEEGAAESDESKGAKGKSGASKDKSKKTDKKSSDVEPGSISEPGSHQSVSVLGIALIAMGEDIGAEMAMRTFNHLLHYGDPVIRRAVPLALALLSTSNPKLAILDMLHKFSHDSDPTVARNAIFSMGLVGCGTNNARLAGMLRNLAQFYHKEPQDLFMVRLAQGLTHLGKGTLTLNPYHSDRMLLTPVALAGLLVTMVSMLDASNIILKDAHYMLFYLAPAIQTRMLVTFDEALNPLPVTVRVGQAVDVVGQAGKPKTITGFQTHTTPVLLGYGERAELATEEYVPLTPIVEGFVILKKNPDYEQ